MSSSNSTFGARIESRRRDLKLSQTELAHKLGVTPQSVQQWEADKTTPRGKRLDLLGTTLLCTKEWLVFGSDANVSFDNSISRADKYTNIPLLDVELAAGQGIHIDAESVTEWIPISTDWIFENRFSKDELVAATVTGDSMTPRLQDGDTILINTAEKKPTSGNVYAIAVDNELRIKRLIKRMDGAWIISSDNKSNPAYQDEVISHHNFEQLRVIGRAVKVLMGSL